MAKIELEVHEELASIFREEPDYYSELLRRALRDAAAQRHKSLGSWVKGLTRLKQPVSNWATLDRQIMLGALGRKDS